jgi:hypothetical protein
MEMVVVVVRVVAIVGWWTALRFHGYFRHLCQHQSRSITVTTAAGRQGNATTRSVVFLRS